MRVTTGAADGCCMLLMTMVLMMHGAEQQQPPGSTVGSTVCEDCLLSHAKSQRTDYQSDHHVKLGDRTSRPLSPNGVPHTISASDKRGYHVERTKSMSGDVQMKIGGTLHSSQIGDGRNVQLLHDVPEVQSVP